MKIIDLRPYADHAQKIPDRFLIDPALKRVSYSNFKIILSHTIDFGIILGINFLLATFYNQSVQELLITNNLFITYSPQLTFNFSISFIPLVSLTYFFTSYFMNHGQTFGMMIIKQRIKIAPNNFVKSIQWAVFSILVYLSGGLILLKKKIFLAAMKDSDYLYQDLMAYKDLPGINLVSELEKHHQHFLRDEEKFKAA